MTSVGEPVSARVPADHLADRTWMRPTWSIDDLIAAQRGRTVSVVFPTRDHADVIGSALSEVTSLIGSLIDEVVVVDTGSADATVSRARSSGARVEVCSPRDRGAPAGRGEAIWRSLEVTDGDLLVIADPGLDVQVPALLGPLLLDDRLSLVKGFRRRPPSENADQGGGRLTELLIRPMLASLRPELAGVVSPLGREFAATRAILSAIPIAPGPSADIGILLDTLSEQGIDAVAQVGLGVAAHPEGALTELGPIGRQIVATLMDRFGVVDSGAPLTSYRAVAGGFEAQRAFPTLRDLPPMTATNLPVS